MTYAAVTAKTSALFAFANTIRQIDTNTLKAAIIPNLAGMDWTKYSPTMDVIGIKDARMLVIPYVSR